MKELLRHLLLLFAAAATLPLTSCGDGDDPDMPPAPEPPAPTTDYKVETGTTDFEFYTGVKTDYGDITFCALGKYLNYENNTYEIGFLRGVLFYGENLKIAYVGKITSLKQIKKLSQAGDWDQGAPFYEKGGYIIEGTYRGTLHYIRLFIPKINYDSTNKLVGYSYEWQQFIPE